MLVAVDGGVVIVNVVGVGLGEAVAQAREPSVKSTNRKIDNCDMRGALLQVG